MVVGVLEYLEYVSYYTECARLTKQIWDYAL